MVPQIVTGLIWLTILYPISGAVSWLEEHDGWAEWLLLGNLWFFTDVSSKSVTMLVIPSTFLVHCRRELPAVNGLSSIPVSGWEENKTIEIPSTERRSGSLHGVKESSLPSLARVAEFPVGDALANGLS